MHVLQFMRTNKREKREESFRERKRGVGEEAIEIEGERDRWRVKNTSHLRWTSHHGLQGAVPEKSIGRGSLRRIGR